MIKFLTTLIFSWTLSVYAFDWQGHRGARGLYPENTIGAMREALKYPVTTLELDVVISKDQNVVVSHEPWMGAEICQDLKGVRVKDRVHNIYKMNYEEIMKFDCGATLHPRFPHQQKVTVGKPQLQTLIEVTEETLKNLKREDVVYNIEIKSTQGDEKLGFQPDYKTFTELVVKTLLSKLPVERFVLQSFDWRVLKYLHERYPKIRLSALIEDKFSYKSVLNELGFHPYIFSPYFENLTQEDINYFHSLGIKVIPWTVNTVSDMEKLMSMKVDGIITDYPNLIESVGQKSCGTREHNYQGKCVKIPENGMPSEVNPGWKCNYGFIQKRSKCIKIKLPKHSILTSDGKTWECKVGYERYRGTCKKVAK